MPIFQVLQLGMLRAPTRPMKLSLSIAAALVTLGAVHCSSDDPKKPNDGTTDNHPGSLVITTPERAAFIEGDDGANVEVKGTGASAGTELTINGEHADVAADGSFHATVTARKGLNVIAAVNGDSKLDSPFLFGHFAKQGTPIKEAAALNIGIGALNGQAPATSFSTIANAFIAKQDLVTAIKGQTMNGDVLGAKWSFKVTNAKYESVNVGFNPAAKGVDVKAAVKKVVVDGTLSMDVLVKKYSGPVKLTAEQALVTGNALLALEKDEALKVAMPAAEAKLEKFKIDSNNIGFPCCVDEIASGFLGPMIEKSIADQIKQQIPSALELTLDGIGLPKQIDVPSLGIAPIPINAKFDSVEFDLGGGTLTASVLFGGPTGGFDPSMPGSKAPGWLQLGQPLARPSRAGTSPFAISLSVDAVNQLLFTAWGVGSITRTLPDTPPVSGLKIDPKLPPVITVGEGGALRLGLGEVVVDATLGSTPFTAALTVQQDVEPKADAQQGGLVLEMKGDPKIAITWLKADEVADGVRTIITGAVNDQLKKLLKPITIPLPKISLEQLGEGFAGQSIAIMTSSLEVDRNTARVKVGGSLSLVQ
jgi:hypothetical protein